MSGRGKGGKGLGKGGAKRHRKVLRDNIQGVTKPAIRRLARRGGVKRISGLIYEETRGVLKVFLESVLRDTVSYAEHARRKTVTALDVVYALKRQGKTLYGYGSAPQGGKSSGGSGGGGGGGNKIGGGKKKRTKKKKKQNPPKPVPSESEDDIPDDSQQEYSSDDEKKYEERIGYKGTKFTREVVQGDEDGKQEIYFEHKGSYIKFFDYDRQGIRFLEEHKKLDNYLKKKTKVLEEIEKAQVELDFVGNTGTEWEEEVTTNTLKNMVVLAKEEFEKLGNPIIVLEASYLPRAEEIYNQTTDLEQKNRAYRYIDKFYRHSGLEKLIEKYEKYGFKLLYSYLTKAGKKAKFQFERKAKKTSYAPQSQWRTKKDVAYMYAYLDDLEIPE
jgi:histone H4